jgi:hypothetical protein
VERYPLLGGQKYDVSVTITRYVKKNFALLPQGFQRIAGKDSTDAGTRFEAFSGMAGNTVPYMAAPCS